MALTVCAAFNSFMKDKVNLNSDRTKTARSSRNSLKDKINGLDDFFPLYSEKNIEFGSFARKTKIRPLDDIDMIFTLSANGCTWEEEYLTDTVYLTTPKNSPEYRNFRHDDSYRLNSRKVINEFIRKLESVTQYQKAEIHRNQNAATLKLTSYDWNFDVVPAFFTTENSAGKTYYIIPDGNGNWIKTDPRIDRKRVTDINQTCDGKVLNVIRVIKYWQKRPSMPSMQSYLLENMVLDYFEAKGSASNYLDIDIINVFGYIKDAIWSNVNDPKGIQGNLNNLSYEDKKKISDKATSDYEVALGAFEFEKQKDQNKAINEWRRVFGTDFPTYG